MRRQTRHRLRGSTDSGKAVEAPRRVQGSWRPTRGLRPRLEVGRGMARRFRNYGVIEMCNAALQMPETYLPWASQTVLERSSIRTCPSSTVAEPCLLRIATT